VWVVKSQQQGAATAMTKSPSSALARESEREGNRGNDEVTRYFTSLAQPWRGPSLGVRTPRGRQGLCPVGHCTIELIQNLLRS